MNKKPKKRKQISRDWKISILYPEHSPIRSCLYRVTFEGLKSWSSVHLIRHHVGVQPYVATQRPDRVSPDNEYDRDSIPQGNPIRMSIVLNAQAWINISRKRLCSKASKETRDAWMAALVELNKIDPELRSVCVKECLYRGFCPEKESCGYTNTAAYTNLLLKYRCGGPNNGWQEMQIKKEQLAQSEKRNLQTNRSQSQKQGTETAKAPEKTPEAGRTEG